MTVKEFLSQLANMKSIEIRWDEYIPGQKTKSHHYEHKQPYIDNSYVGYCSRGIDKFWLDMEIFCVEILGHRSIYIIACPKKAQIVKNNKVIADTDYTELPGQVCIEDLMEV